MNAEGSEPSSGENTHELFKWFEWLTRLKLNVHLLNVGEICSERSEMVGVVPLPRRGLVFCKNTSREESLT